MPSKFDALKKTKTPKEQETEPTPPPAVPPMESKQSRATGKRSNPDYTQIGAYIPKTLNKDVKRLLVDDDSDLSDLITKLLQDWVSSKAIN
jgi:hypothetical protein